MDWVALPLVVSSATVAIVSAVIIAMSKRVDRKHAAALDYEQRVWEAKSTAHIDLIRAYNLIIKKSSTYGRGPRL